MLNQRFGEAENYRNARLLKRVMLVSGVMSLLMTLYYLIIPFIGYSPILDTLNMFNILLQVS